MEHTPRYCERLAAARGPSSAASAACAAWPARAAARRQGPDSPGPLAGTLGQNPFGVRLAAHCTHPTPAAVRVIAGTCPYAMLSPGLAQHARHRQLADRLLVCARLLARTLSCTAVPQEKMTQRLLSACLSHTRNRQEAALATQEREARGLHTLLRRGVDAARRPLLQRVRHHLRAMPRPLLSAAGALPAPLSVAPVQKGRARLPPMHWACPWHRYGSAPSSALHSKRGSAPTRRSAGSRATRRALRQLQHAASRSLPHSCALPLILTQRMDTLGRRAASDERAWPGRRAEMRAPRLRSPSAATSRISRASRPRSQMSSSWLKFVRALHRAPRTPLATRTAAGQAAAGRPWSCRRPARCRQWRLEQPPSERAALSVDGHGRCSDSPSAPSPS